MRTLIRNIKTLAGILPEGQRLLKGKAMAHLEAIDNAHVLIENGAKKNLPISCVVYRTKRLPEMAVES